MSNLTLPHTFRPGQECAVLTVAGKTVRVLTPAVLTKGGVLYLRRHMATLDWLREAQQRSVNGTLGAEDTRRMQEEDQETLRRAGLQDTPESGDFKELPFVLEELICQTAVVTDVMDPKNPRVLGTFSFSKEKLNQVDAKS